MFIYKTCSTDCFHDGHIVFERVVNIKVVTVDGRGALKLYGDCRVDAVVCPVCGVRQNIHICTLKAIDDHRKTLLEKGGNNNG